jgi:hypothetical protein
MSCPSKGYGGGLPLLLAILTAKAENGAAKQPTTPVAAQQGQEARAQNVPPPGAMTQGGAPCREE